MATMSDKERGLGSEKSDLPTNGRPGGNSDVYDTPQQKRAEQPQPQVTWNKNYKIPGPATAPSTIVNSSDASSKANADALARQQALIQNLFDQAQGKGPVMGSQELADAYRNAAMQRMSQALNTQQGGGGAQLRVGMQGQQNIMRGQAGAQQMLKLQQEQKARGMLNQLIGQAMQQNATQAGINAQAAFGSNSISDSALRAMLQSMLGRNISDAEFQTARQSIAANAPTNMILGNPGVSSALQGAGGALGSIMDMGMKTNNSGSTGSTDSGFSGALSNSSAGMGDITGTDSGFSGGDFDIGDMGGSYA